MGPQTYSACSLEELKQRSDEIGGVQVLLQLQDEELRRSASRWTVRHLVAYRLLTEKDEPVLDILKNEHDEGCTICTAGSVSSPALDAPMTRALIQGPRLNVFQSSESELMRCSHGPFWAALARACRPEEISAAKAYPQRERRPVERKHFVNSREAIPGSSSSPLRYSSSEYEMGMDELDEDGHDSRRQHPEEVTVQLVSCFIQHALHLCLVQGSPDVEIRLRVERNRAETCIAGTENIVAVDDGGICQMRRQADGWTTTNAFLALIEAKKAFRYLRVDERTGALSPVVSDDTVAQYLGEAVVTWKENQMFLQDDVFIIAATNTFIRFIHFKFGSHYSKYLNTISENEQKDLANRHGEDTCVRMQSTTWVNLQSAEGRKQALCLLFALLKWRDTVKSIRIQRARYLLTDESDFSMEEEESD